MFNITTCCIRKPILYISVERLKMKVYLKCLRITWLSIRDIMKPAEPGITGPHDGEGGTGPCSLQKKA